MAEEKKGSSEESDVKEAKASKKEDSSAEAKAKDEKKSTTKKTTSKAKTTKSDTKKADKEESPKEESPKAETKEEKPKAKKKAAPKKKGPVKPMEDFDWDAFADSEEYSKDEREKLDEMYSETLTEIEEKEVVKGKVMSVGKKEVVVNLGYKSEGIIQSNEFRYREDDLKEGDEVDVYIHEQEDSEGQLVISHKTARIHSAWRKVNEALETGEIIMGHVKCRTKGGLIVDVFGIEAFLPGSQIDVKPIRDYDMYVGKNMEFKVVKINKEFKNVVVSHKALIEAELEEQKKQIIGGLEKGQVLEGTVKNITSYGVFIDLGGVDGLVHITDLSWGRVNHPEEVVDLDEKVNVVILDFDDEKKRIALGMKQLESHPWDALDEKLQVGDKVKGKVVVLADYGAFVEIQPGVEGLIHVSEMSWSQHLRSAQDFLKVGDEVEAVVLTLDREDRKMSLGMKQLMPDPWEGIDTKYPVDSKHKAIVRNFTNFGVFVELEEGVDGLIHISDLSWSKKVKHPSEFCKIGDEIEVVVLEVDPENRRLSLGHKQLEENPWDVFESVFTVGSKHEGTVVSMNDKAGTVALQYGVEGFCPKRHLKKEDGTHAKVEEKLEFEVIEFNKEGRKIVLSHTKTWDENVSTDDLTTSRKPKKKSSKSTSRAVKAVNQKAERTTLGDLDALAQLKDQMDDDDKKEEGED